MTYIKLDPCSTRLGNWMFQYAAAKCATPSDDVTFVISGNQDIDAVKKYACLWPDAQYVREAPKGTQMRIGLFQNSKYVNRTFARNLFLNNLYSSVQSYFSNSTLLHGQSSQPLVSIHVRRGDYLSLPHRHPFVGEKYLREAISRFPNMEFMIFSDDLPWCKKFFQGPQFHFSEGNSVLADLYLMTQCKSGHICSNSTFSWWGAYLGEGKTIFPSMWFGPAIKGEDWQGLYFDGSEVIKNGYSVGMFFKARALMAKNICGDMLRKVGLR